jgi:hypothetical protein
MSSNLDALVSCEGKTRFPEPRLAERAKGRKGKRTIYRCKHCKGWHIGNTLGRPLTDDTEEDWGDWDS